jgi:hypothetical protein
MTFNQDLMDEINQDFMNEFNQAFMNDMNELIRSIRSSEPDIMTPSKSGDHYKFDMTK